MSSRFAQCTETCTTDCGHCKGRPVEALRADNERLARRLAGRFEETEKLRNEAEGLRQELDEARAELAERDLIIDRVHAAEKAFLSRAVDAEREVARLRPVVEAAKAWRAMRADSPTKPKPESAALMAAVDAYRSSTPDAEPAPRIIDDGFGNVWPLCDRPTCYLEIVRPGKVQCRCDEAPGVRVDTEATP